MAFDGTTIAAIVNELNIKIKDGRISKIAQPENDELLLTIKCADRTNARLLISANASLPLVYLTDDNKISPPTAPGFCMLLRKYISSGKIINISQFGMERVIDIEVEHLNELGDYGIKHLIIEIMGKHSNIILCEKNDEGKLIVIDSIKRISGLVSSVREVLPKREYFIPNTMDKVNPFTFNEGTMQMIINKPVSVSKAIYTTLTGFSKVLAIELCVRSGIDADSSTASLNDAELSKLYDNITSVINNISNGTFMPNIVSSSGMPLEYAVFRLDSYSDCDIKPYDTVSAMIFDYYSIRAIKSRINQKSYDLRHIVSNALMRSQKKLDLQQKQYNSTLDRDKYRIYGELLTAFGYMAEPGAKQIVCNNYYTNEDITIPLDPAKSAIDNAKKYFARYNKLKRTYEALSVQIEETTSDIEYLNSINNALDIATTTADLDSIKKELREFGYIKSGGGKKTTKQKTQKSTALHYISSDGYDIYVGKNNYQNDELTFGNRAPGDWWFHSKKIAGSHVVLKGKPDQEIPDRAFEEAGALAAYYSSGRENGKVEIDYTEIFNVKKPKNAKPGFVVYYTNYSLIATTDISHLTLVND